MPPLPAVRQMTPFSAKGGQAGAVNSAVFQRTVDYPDEYSPGYHAVLDDGPVVTVRWDQLDGLYRGEPRLK